MIEKHAGTAPAPTTVTKGAVPKGRVRDRIFDTACRLFYEHGIRAVGVDAIAQEAGTNKMSFYRSFGSKEELVAEYLRKEVQEYWTWWDAALAVYPNDPRRQVEALFEAYTAHAREHCPRGCALSNAAVENSDADNVVRQIVCEQQTEMRRRLRQLAQDMGAREPDVLGDALLLLIEGGYSTSVTSQRGAGPMCAASAAARVLIQAHLPDPSA